MKRIICFLLALCLVTGYSGQALAAEDAAKWENEPSMKYGRVSFGTAVIDSKIYVMGGAAGSDPLNIVEIYDTESKTWTLGAPMSKRQRFLATCALNRKIYAFGGAVNNEMNVYDVDTNEWTEGSKLPFLGADGIAGAISGKIYVVTSVGVIQVYDPTSDTWDAEPNKLPFNVVGSTVAFSDDCIYIIGGPNGNMIYAYNVSTSTLTEVTKMFLSHKSAGIVVRDKKIYIISGGISGNSTKLTTVNIYDLQTDSWKIGPEVTEARVGHHAISVGDKIYILGGQSTNYTNTVESLQVGSAPAPTDGKLSVLLNVGEVVQISVTQSLADNDALNFTSSNEAVATVSASGKVTAVGEGTADIYAQNADGTFREFIPVKVMAGGADAYRLAVHIKPGQQTKLYLSDDTDSITWSTLDAAVAAVNDSGVVTANAKGLAIVQAELNGKTHQIYVRVAV